MYGEYEKWILNFTHRRPLDDLSVNEVTKLKWILVP
jgi:hypothetical protein